MSITSGLIILLLNGGYWFGGQPGTITVGWATTSQPADAVLSWQLMMGPSRVGGGRARLLDAGPWTVTLTPPEVRARTTLRWVYRVAAGSTELAAGEVQLQVFPRDLLSGTNRLLEGKTLVVWDSSGGLTGVLSRAGVVHRKIESASALGLGHPDVVLVGPDEIDSSFTQAAPVGQAESGAGVMLFAQTRVDVLAGYGLGRRSVPPRLEWRAEHPLLASFSPSDLQSWLTACLNPEREGAGQGFPNPERKRASQPASAADDSSPGLLGLPSREVRPVQLPADEGALEIAYWPREAPGEQPVPIDALLVAKAVGRGRLVLCQLPLGPWDSDPRSQLLLANAINYLLSRPEPTPPPSVRRPMPAPQPATVPSITIPSGDKP